MASGNLKPVPLVAPGSSSTPPAISVNPDAWNSIVIGGVDWPGNARIVGLKRHRKDLHGAPGTSQEKQVSMGMASAPFTIILTIADEPNDDTQWQCFATQLVPALLPKVAKINQPIDVYHPALEVYRIRSLSLEDMTLPQLRGSDPDILEVTIRVREYAPSKAKKIVTLATSLVKIGQGFGGLASRFSAASNAAAKVPGLVSSTTPLSEQVQTTVDQTQNQPATTAQTLANPPSSNSSGPSSGGASGSF